MSDKIMARDIVKGTVGDQFLSTLYATSPDPAAIDWSALPREYVCKVNHMSGGVIIVWDGAPAECSLPSKPSLTDSIIQIRPERMDSERMIEILKYWLSLDYSWRPGKQFVEWAYQDIARAVLVEELLLDDSGGIPKDYRFYVFNGVAEIVIVDGHMTKARTKACMSMDWRVHPAKKKGMIRTTPSPLRPTNWDEMKEAAEQLGSLVDFVRVDLYDLGNRVVFGELTNYPSAASSPFVPRRYERVLGDLWTIEGY